MYYTRAGFAPIRDENGTGRDETAMAMFRERRRAQRELSGLHGSYLLARCRELGWHDCHLVDTNEYGAGARLRGPSVEVGDEVLICLDGPDGAASIRLQATVRHVRADFFGATRAGVEFASLEPDQRHALICLLRGERV